MGREDDNGVGPWHLDDVVGRTPLAPPFDDDGDGDDEVATVEMVEMWSLDQVVSRTRQHRPRSTSA